jgi:hypothetical protein
MDVSFIAVNRAISTKFGSLSVKMLKFINTFIQNSVCVTSMKIGYIERAPPGADSPQMYLFCTEVHHNISSCMEISRRRPAARACPGRSRNHY